MKNNVEGIEAWETVKGHEVRVFKAKLRPQIFAGIAANLGAFAWGTLMSWSATAIPKLRESNDFGEIVNDDASWMSSIATLGACTVCIPASLLLDKIGRRKTMMIFAPLYVAGWLLIYFSQNVNMLIAGRFVIGFAGGLFSIATPTYLAETSEPRIRGMLINGYDLMICVGMLFSLIIGKYSSWRTPSLVNAFVPVVLVTVMFFMPESPRFLMMRGREEEASKSLRWLRGATSHDQIEAEFLQLKQSMGDNIVEVDWFKRFGLLKARTVRIPFILSFILFMVQVGTGIAAVLFYTVDIFEDAGSSMNQYDSAIITGAVQIVASVGSALVVDRFGRRILLIGSEILLILSLAALGAFFHVKEVKGEAFAVDNLGWLPLVSLIVYLVGYSMGIGPIPFSVMPELLPQRVRGFAASLIITFKWGTTFIVTRFFTDLIEAIGADGCYWFFASLCLLGVIYIFFFIPETKQKSLEEIQLYFEKKEGGAGRNTHQNHRFY